MKDIYKCISCGLEDKTVEAGGIYYCPNPFCMVSGATNWKRENLDVLELNDGLILNSNKGWLLKGMKVIEKMEYGLGAKIMALKKTKNKIKELQRES